VLLALLLGSVFVNLILLAAMLFGVSSGPVIQETLVEGSVTAHDKILHIPVHGILIAGVSSPWSGPDPVQSTLDALARAEADTAVKGIVLDIDTPGGGISDCDRIRHRILKFRKARPGVPIVVSMRDLATSGGYYIAAPADWILAQRSTITGSIGVIMQMYNVEKLTEHVGVRMETVKSGPRKDAGSPFRTLTEAERKHFQGMIDAMYRQFLDVVLEGRGGRGLTEEALKPLADGGVLIAAMALEGNLIDGIGFLDDAFAEARKRAKAPEAKVVRYERPAGLFDLFRVQAAPPAAPGLAALDRLATRLADGSARMMYLWSPGF
jgi:protease-4